MNQQPKLKFAVPVFVLSLVNAAIYVLAAVLVFTGTDQILDMIGQDPNLVGIENVLSVTAVVLLGFAVLVGVGGYFAQWKKGWNIFLLVFGIIIVLGAIAQGEYINVLLSGTMVVLTILNIKDFNDKLQAEPQVKLGLEARLSELNDLLVKGVITNEEYQRLREEAIRTY